MTTSAPAMAAPDLSVTVPLMYPVSWAGEAGGRARATISTPSHTHAAPNKFFRRLERFEFSFTLRPPRKIRIWETRNTRAQRRVIVATPEVTQRRKLLDRTPPPPLDDRRQRTEVIY